MKLLIGYDSSAEAKAAIDDLKRAGLPEKGEAVVFSVAGFYIPPSVTESPYALNVPSVLQARAFAEEQRDALLEEARAAAILLKDDLPGWTFHGEAVVDSPAGGLLKRAEEWKPDLICIGAPHHSRLERLFFGSNCQKVVSHARGSVRIGRIVTADGPLRLMLAMDGSPDAHAAAASMASRRWPAGTEVCVAAVRDSRFVAAAGALLDPLYSEPEGGLLSGTAAKLAAAGLKATTEILDGRPAAVLLARAAEWNAHCVFAGAGGCGALDRLLLGSVSAALAARAPCSVEVVRRKVSGS
jgi:nucleotide-binding universal stress UspA family protein